MSVERPLPTVRLVRCLALLALVASCAESTAVPGPATTITVNAGDGQTAAAGSPVATPPSVRVTDAAGRGVNGESVTFAVTGGGGSIVGATQVTSGDGVASVSSWTLGDTPGANTLTATATGLTGSPVTFTGTGAGVAFHAAHGSASGTGTSVVLAGIQTGGADRLLLCVVGVEPFNSTVVPTSIALDDGAGGGAQALTQLGAAYGAMSAGLRWSTFQLVAPAVGLRRLTATLSASTNWSVSCVSYAGVDQATPFGFVVTASGSFGAASLSTGSNVPRTLAWAHLISSDAGFVAGAGATPRQVTGADRSAMVDGNVRVPAGTPHTFLWTYSGQYGAQGVMLRPAALP